MKQRDPELQSQSLPQSIARDRNRGGATRTIATLAGAALFLAGGQMAVQAIDQAKLVQILLVVSHFGLTLLQILCR